MDKFITIDIHLEQTVHDLLVECNLIGKNAVDAANYELQADIMTPDDAQTKSIICRAHTEAFGNVKLACRRYMTTGRTEDENKLERLVAHVYYKKVYDNSGTITTYTPYWYNGNVMWLPKTGDTEGTPVPTSSLPAGAEDTEEVGLVEYETVELAMNIPNFDTAVTDALKNHIHKYIVDYVMWRFLQNQADEKCAEYKKLADEEDYPNIEHDLTCRDRFIKRKSQFF